MHVYSQAHSAVAQLHHDSWTAENPAELSRVFNCPAVIMMVQLCNGTVGLMLAAIYPVAALYRVWPSQRHFGVTDVARDIFCVTDVAG
jgi:hypothetical protein